MTKREFIRFIFVFSIFHKTVKYNPDKTITITSRVRYWLFPFRLVGGVGVALFQFAKVLFNQTWDSVKDFKQEKRQYQSLEEKVPKITLLQLYSSVSA